MWLLLDDFVASTIVRDFIYPYYFEIGSFTDYVSFVDLAGIFSQ